MASFPYCKKRIEVDREDSIQISPLQIAINSLKKKNRELNDVISHEPLDLKKLQLRLQGSVMVTVNSGSLTYARAFIGNTGMVTTLYNWSFFLVRSIFCGYSWTQSLGRTSCKSLYVIYMHKAVFNLERHSRS